MKVIKTVLLSIISGSLFFALISYFTYIKFFERELIPNFLYIILLITLGIPILGIYYYSVNRIKLLKKKEEKDA